MGKPFNKRIIQAERRMTKLETRQTKLEQALAQFWAHIPVEQRMDIIKEIDGGDEEE